MRAPIELDLHVPSFNYPDVGPDAVFEKLVDIAITAEQAGFTSLTLMDHYHQIPPVGPPQNWMFEGNTMLAGIAARTQKLALGLLVGGVNLSQPGAARQDHDNARHNLRRPCLPRHRRRLVRG